MCMYMLYRSTIESTIANNGRGGGGISFVVREKSGNIFQIFGENPPD